MTTLPQPPELKAHDEVGAFQDAIREWATEYELVYAVLYPVKSVEPPKPLEVLVPKPDGEPVPERLEETDVEWVSCERVDDGTVQHVAEYKATGKVKHTERVVTGTKRLDFRGEKGTPISEWGQDAHDVAELLALIADPVTGGPTDPWPRILQHRQDILVLAQARARQQAIHNDHQERLAKWAEQNSVWYFKAFLPWEIERVKYQVAHEAYESWKSYRQMVANKRAERKRQIVYGLVKTAITAAIVGAIFLVGSKLL